MMKQFVAWLIIGACLCLRDVVDATTAADILALLNQCPSQDKTQDYNGCSLCTDLYIVNSVEAYFSNLTNPAVQIQFSIGDSTITVVKNGALNTADPLPVSSPNVGWNSGGSCKAPGGSSFWVTQTLGVASASSADYLVYYNSAPSLDGFVAFISQTPRYGEVCYFGPNGLITSSSDPIAKNLTAALAIGFYPIYNGGSYNWTTSCSSSHISGTMHAASTNSAVNYLAPGLAWAPALFFLVIMMIL
jgi:hypothetical protein